MADRAQISLRGWVSFDGDEPIPYLVIQVGAQQVPLDMAAAVGFGTAVQSAIESVQQRVAFIRLMEEFTELRGQAAAEALDGWLDRASRGIEAPKIRVPGRSLGRPPSRPIRLDKLRRET